MLLHSFPGDAQSRSYHGFRIASLIRSLTARGRCAPFAYRHFRVSHHHHPSISLPHVSFLCHSFICPSRSLVLSLYSLRKENPEAVMLFDLQALELRPAGASPFVVDELSYPTWSATHLKSLLAANADSIPAVYHVAAACLRADGELKVFGASIEGTVRPDACGAADVRLPLCRNCLFLLWFLEGLFLALLLHYARRSISIVNCPILDYSPAPPSPQMRCRIGRYGTVCLCPRSTLARYVSKFSMPIVSRPVDLCTSKWRTTCVAALPMRACSNFT